MLLRAPWMSALCFTLFFCVWSTVHGQAPAKNSSNDICSLCTCKLGESWSLLECRSKTMTRIPYVPIRKKKPDGISFHLWLPLLGKVQQSDFNRRFEVTDLVIDGASRDLYLTSTAFDAISESLQRLSIQFPMTFIPETALTFPFLWTLRFLEYFKVVRSEGSSEGKILVDETSTHEYTRGYVSNSEMVRRVSPVFPEKTETKTPALAYKTETSKIPERGSTEGTTTQKMTTAPVSIVGDTQYFLLASALLGEPEFANSNDNISSNSERRSSRSDNNDNNINNIESEMESVAEPRDKEALTSDSTDQPVHITETTTITEKSVNTDHLLTLNQEVIMSGSTFKGPVPLVLKELYIENFGITDIQRDTFLNFVALKALGLSKNRVKNVPFVRSLLELTHLSMAHNEVDYVDADVSFPLALQHLDFSHNALSWIQLDATPSLRWLDLSFNEGLRFQSFWISEDTHLESLNVSYTGLNNAEALASVSFAAMKCLQFLGTRMPCTCKLRLIRDVVPEVLGSCASPSGALPQVWTVAAEELMKLNAYECEVKAGRNNSLEVQNVEEIDNLGRLEETNRAHLASSAAAPPLCIGLRQCSCWICFVAVYVLAKG